VPCWTASGSVAIAASNAAVMISITSGENSARASEFAHQTRERRLIPLWIASPGLELLKAGMKGRATSNPASRFLLLTVRSVVLSASPFVLRKQVEISESRTREFYSLAITRLQPALQMALQEASSAIRSVDFPMHRKRPSCTRACLGSPAQGARERQTHSSAGTCWS
jgi:hypothetical protein